MTPVDREPHISSVKAAEGALEFFSSLLPEDDAQRQAWVTELAIAFEDAQWDALYRFKDKIEAERVE